MARAAIYCRISEDRTGAGLGVQRQEEDCRAFCAQRGWEVAEVLVDNDISAYSGKTRPGYQLLTEAMKDGTVDAVVCWHPDRLHRSPRELEDFITLVEATGATVATVKAGEYDLSTATGRMSARIVGAVARGESEHKSERIRRKHRQLAEAGEGRGGGTRPFGFSADRLTVDPAEAELVREAASRILRGDGIRTICADWEQRGIRTPADKSWTPTSLSRMLLSARIAGLRSHQGVVVAKAVWEPLIDETTHHQLVAVLTDPARRTNRSARSYLLKGLCRCALCGAKMVARPRGDGSRRYICAKGPGFDGCGSCFILSEPLEELVVEAVLQRVDTPAFAAAVAAQTADRGDGLAEAIAADEAKLGELAEMWDAGEITRAEWMKLRGKITDRLEDARRRAARSRRGLVLDGAGQLRAAWPALTLDRQRAILGELIDAITISAGRRGLNRFDPTRVDITWRI